jgi:hypothetical protein
VENNKIIKRSSKLKDLEKTIFKQVISALRDRISQIRDNDTGRFPIVSIQGNSFKTVRISVQAEEPLLEKVKSILNQEEHQFVDFKILNSRSSPKVFLSWATEDRAIAQDLAIYLMENGVDTWWSEWEIRGGDSLRRKIDEGLATCTHFVVLLTEASINKPWVNEEIDAGLILHIDGSARLIPVRHNLEISQLPVLLKTRNCPSISEVQYSFKNLLEDILEINKKPALGKTPNEGIYCESKYSKAATSIARIFIERSTDACSHSGATKIQELIEETGMSMEAIEDALHELRAFIATQRNTTVYPSASLFSEFDQLFKPWNPEEDALYLANLLNNEDSFPTETKLIDSKILWGPRRLNSAISYLVDRNAISTDNYMGTAPYISYRCNATPETRRYIKNQSN